eukprot:TRINITY_DN20712_c0_g1_i1.p1 TRINITY_DN20712_c0_g1~~TRINITY_DN20712_c0_g1_i1.p1  ORF type:complete len:129 (-),score=3.92 TRINITY_DN20712_c0_g1_i1:142-528(-)
MDDEIYMFSYIFFSSYNQKEIMQNLMTNIFFLHYEVKFRCIFNYYLLQQRSPRFCKTSNQFKLFKMKNLFQSKTSVKFRFNTFWLLQKFFIHHEAKFHQNFVKFFSDKDFFRFCFSLSAKVLHIMVHI